MCPEKYFIITKNHLKNKRIGNTVFTKSNGESIRSIKEGFKNTLKRAGINGLRLHDLRHIFASRLVMMGIDLVIVKELLGHKSIAMTMRYSHIPLQSIKRWL